jgi:hypothetical protein
VGSVSELSQLDKSRSTPAEQVGKQIEGGFGWYDNPWMSQDDFFPKQTTLLRMPSWLGRGVTEESELPLAPGDYKVTPGAKGERWTVTSLKNNEVIYNGIGPVEVSR